MSRSHRSFLSRLDDVVRWTGIPGRVAEDMSGNPSVDRNHRPMRWFPLFYIAVSSALLILPLMWLLKRDLFSPSAVVSFMTVMVLAIAVGAWTIHSGGPLGKPSSEDDEREAALRKDAFLFSFGLLAGLNCLVQPIILIVSHWQNWQTMHSVVVAACAVTLNAVLLGTLPTLYASWNIRYLPKE